MKRKLAILLITLTGTFFVVGLALAKNDKINLKGEVITVDAGTLMIETNKGLEYLVTVPEGFDLNLIEVGDAVIVKGRLGVDDTVQADWMKLVGRGKKAGARDDQDKPEGIVANKAYCTEGKKVSSHPLAPKMSARYGVSEDWVMGYYCSGYSTGAIMLAIKTSQIDGVTADPGTLLADRGGGKSWGHIWKDLGLIGSEKSGHSPPGLLKKQGEGGSKGKD